MEKIRPLSPNDLRKNPIPPDYLVEFINKQLTESFDKDYPMAFIYIEIKGEVFNWRNELAILYQQEGWRVEFWSSPIGEQYFIFSTND